MIIVYAKTITVSTRCRLCGERNPADMPVVLVGNPTTNKIVRRYYCMSCFRTLRKVARRHIPTLTAAQTDKQAGQQLAVLLGIETGRAQLEPATPERPPTFEKHDISVDLELHFPMEHVLNRVPFEKFYEEARRERKS